MSETKRTRRPVEAALFPALAAVVLVLARPAVGLADCPKGFVLHSEDQKNYYCQATQELQDVQAEICAMEAKLASDRKAIEAFRTRLPGFFEALEEWRNRSDEAVRKAMTQSLDLLLGGLMTIRADQVKSAAKLSREEARTLQEIWVSHIGKNKALERAAHGDLRRSLEITRRWETLSDLYGAAGALQKAIKAIDLGRSDAAAVEKAARGLLMVLDYAASLPRFAKVLKPVAGAMPAVGLADFAIDYAFAATQYAFSWKRINQLRDTRVHAEAAALQEVQEKHFAEQKALVARRSAILDPSIKPPPCKTDADGPSQTGG